MRDRMGVGLRSSMIVDDGVFDPDEDGERGQSVMIRCSDPAGAAQAITKATLRFMLVSDDGVEYSLEELDENPDLDGELLASYVSKPTISAEGATFHIDAKGGVTEAVAAAYFRIVREALLAEGIESARVEAPPRA
jgi:hypothetical protein